MAFGDTISSADSPSTFPSGIGGDANTIWHCDASVDKVYELDTSDFSQIRSAASPSINPNGIGGDANTIWHNDCDTDKIYELDTSDFSEISSADSPSIILPVSVAMQILFGIVIEI